MDEFPDSVAAELLAKCKRHCCICLRFRGRNLEIHHIQPKRERGKGTSQNGIPVCFDCHAEIESKSNMGRKFTPQELRRHRDEWFKVVRDQPEKLLAASRRATESGPLEALLAELAFNRHNVSGADDRDYPPLEVDQLRRAIAANALATLPPKVEESVYAVYRAARLVNYNLEKLLNLRSASLDTQPTQKECNKRREELRDSLVPAAIDALEEALGRPA